MGWGFPANSGVLRIERNESLIPLGDGENPPYEKPPTKWINVNGREEHETLLRDTNKMWSLGLDPTFEKMVYLKRWGTWLNGSHTYDGKL